MKKIIGLIAILLMVMVIVLFTIDKKEVVAPTKKDATNISYTINGEVLSMFGEPVYGDLDKDGDMDAAVWLIHNPGGSGTFYYAALAINTDGEYKSTENMFLGDRIAPQTVEIHEGRAVYNFAERRADEPMTTPPSIGKSVWVHYDASTNSIGEWVKDFEGESNVCTMDAKICPDGSAVGRTGPNCEFAPCPNI